MGYNTNYTLELKRIRFEKPVTIESIVQKISNATDINKQDILKDLQALQTSKEVSAQDIIDDFRKKCKNGAYAIGVDGKSGSSTSWYDHQGDLIEFSRHYPHWLFTLYGEGEEAGDLWRKYFFQGKCQEAKAVITFSDFDETLLT